VRHFLESTGRPNLAARLNLVYNEFELTF
jgi:hypothetical protein